ncbi:MAG: biotin--[acetyl-CoA-carboxylase] ligase [Beutenbergiaceae bacterium]
MNAPQSLPPVRVVAATGSTQTDLLALATDSRAWPHLSGIRAIEQTAGRGRGERSWDTDGLTALTASLVLRPTMAPAQWTWLPMLTGLAVVRALAQFGATSALKWPNDVVLASQTPFPGWGTWRKVGGVRSDVLADSAAVVVGIGVNLAGPPPVPWAAALAEVLADRTPEAAELLDDIRAQLSLLLQLTPAARRSAVEHGCLTIGAQVRVELPGGEQFAGRALALNDDGGLVVRGDDGGIRVVMAGDIEHLRVPDLSAE